MSLIIFFKLLESLFALTGSVWETNLNVKFNQPMTASVITSSFKGDGSGSYNIPGSGASFSKIGAVFSTTNIILPDVNKFSGDLLTIDNRLRFSPSDQQIVVVTNSITF